MRLFRAALVVICVALPGVAASHSEWDGLRQQIRTTLHVPEDLPHAAPKSYGKFRAADGVDADRVSYATGYELRVPAIVYHPAGATITKHPALIIVNGHEGDKSSWYASAAGILYARAGAVVLTYDPIGEYERNSERRSKTNQHDTVVEPAEELGRRLSGLMITDVEMAVSYLLSRPDVDPKRIAVLGFSMGSFVGSLSCAVDTRIDACVLVGGGNLDGPGGRWDTAKKMCEAIPYKSLLPLGDRGAVIYALNAKRGPTLVINGTADTTEDIPHHGPDFFNDLRSRTVAMAGSEKNVFEARFVQGGTHSPYFLTKEAALWLNSKLKFPNWTNKQIEAMPESTPAAGEGLRVLGDGFPLPARDELHAIPEAVWDAERDAYIYGTWLDRAQSAVAQHAP